MDNNLPPVGSLKPNSNKFKEQQAEQAAKEKRFQELSQLRKSKEPFKKVGSGEAVILEKTLAAKFKEAFIAEDSNVVKKYIIEEKIIPEVKSFVLEVFYDGLSMLLGTRKKSSSVDRTDYAAISSGSKYRYSSVSSGYKNSKSYEPETLTESDSPCEILFKVGPNELPKETKARANQVLSDLMDAAVEYGAASVLDAYDLAGITLKKNSKFTDNDYGWTPEMLTHATIRRVREGYLLELPSPCPVD